MTRVKEEFRKRGVKLESDYEFLPYDGIETVHVHPETAVCAVYHVSAGWTWIQLNRDGSIDIIDEFGRHNERSLA